jgi:hypothetical protein
MQPDGTYQLIEALGSCHVGTVWSAVDAAGNPLTVAVLDSAAAADQRWREAFASTANALMRGELGGPRVVSADLSASSPWVACETGDGPGAELVFTALGLQYYPAPPSTDPDATLAAGQAGGSAQLETPAAPAEEQVLHQPTVGLPAVPTPPPPPPHPTTPVSPVSPLVSPQTPPDSAASPDPTSADAQPVSGAPQPPATPPQSLGEGTPPEINIPQWPAAGVQPPLVDMPQQVPQPFDPGYPPLPSGESEPRRRTGLWVTVAVGVVVALVAVVGVYAWQSDSGTPVAESSGTPVASASPTPSDNRPSEHNTGVPKDAKLRVVEGDRTFGKDGQIYSGLDLHGNVRITGDNITLRRSIIRGVGKMNGDQCTSAAVIWIDGGTNVTIQDVEVYGAEPNACLDGIWAENARLSRVNIHHVVDGVKAYDNVTIQLSYIHDLAHFSSSPTHDGGPTHNDGVQSWEGNHTITLRQNTIKLTPQDNAAFQVNQSRGTRATDIHVRDNWLDGGWCTLNFSEGDGPTPMTGIYVTDNRFGATSSCPIYLSGGVKLSANEGNVWDDTDEPIPPPRRPSG